MNPCYECPIEEIYFCCKYHPETGETKELMLKDGTIRIVCPSLNLEGLCTEIDNEERRGGACRSYECFKFKNSDLTGLMSKKIENFKEGYGIIE